MSREICLKLKEARRAAKISQGELAAEVGCKQSAISMFEQGQPTKLNSEAVEKIARKFGIDISEKKKAEDDTEISVSIPNSKISPPHSGFCPNPACPSNHRYEVEGRVLVMPDREKADPVGGRFCAFCGELLERKCPNCGALIHNGSVCSLCGEPYIVV